MSLAVSVELENNPQYGVVVSSRRVAEGLGKKHYNVVRDLDQVLENSNLSSLKNSDIRQILFLPLTQWRIKNVSTVSTF